MTLRIVKQLYNPEAEMPTPTFKMPTKYEDLMAMKQKATEARKRTRQDGSAMK